jgi:hypothetical protein
MSEPLPPPASETTPPPPADALPDGNGRPVEIGGRKKGLEPTRYGDWEKDGRCIDF